MQQWHLALMAKVSGAMDKGRTPRSNRYPRHQMTPKAIQINSVMNDILKCCFFCVFHVLMIIYIIPPFISFSKTHRGCSMFFHELRQFRIWALSFGNWQQMRVPKRPTAEYWLIGLSWSWKMGLSKNVGV